MWFFPTWPTKVAKRNLSRTTQFSGPIVVQNLGQSSHQACPYIYIQNLSTKLVIPLLNKINFTTYFKNLTVKLHVLYVLNIYIKFCVKWILFTIWFINLYFLQNFKLQKLQIKSFIDNIAVDIWFSRNFASMEDIRRRCNIIVDLLKFTSNKKILSKVIFVLFFLFLRTYWVRLSPKFTTNFVTKIFSIYI